ncbi:hypothetical protein AYO22_09175 [Fonsecaea multimorphosa]|nr:hypothetical protein AYO22_09175 [Fonsecaea multimorphosa]
MFRVESPTSFAQGVNRDRRRKRLSPWCNSGPRGSSSQHAQREESGKCCEKDDPLPSRLLDPGDSDNLYNCGWKLTRVDVVIFSGWYIFPTRQLAECWDNHASTLAFSNMTCPQKHQITTGLIDTNFLSSMVSEAGQDSPIVLACRAIGHAFLTSKVDTPETRSKRAATYGQALEATNMALEDPIMQTQDETLASVWLLSLYETGADHTISAHCLTRPLARDLFWLIYSSVLVRCFITNMASPSESSSWFRELEKDLTEDELPTHQLCVYGHHASTFCATIRQVIDKWTTGSARAAAEIFAEVEGFERRMQQLWHVTSGNPSVETVEISDSNIRLLCCRTYLHAFRLKLQLTLLELLGKMRTERCDVRAGTLQHEFQLRVETVQSVADEILACVPLLLSTNTASGGSPKLTPRVWRDGVRLLWPLRLVALWSATRDDQKRAAKIILQQIRDEVGIYPAGAFPPSFLADMATK